MGYRFNQSVINIIWCGEPPPPPPNSWQKAIRITIHMKRDLKNCINHTGISLLNSRYKRYANILKDKLYTHYENIIGEEQNGFRK
jgi:hypothetical protein